MTEKFGALPFVPPRTVIDGSLMDPPAVIDVGAGEPSPTAIEPDEESPTKLETLYQRYFLELGRIAFLLTRDLQEAEDIVSDVFLRVAEKYNVQDLEDPLAFLRAAVVNRSRSVLRHRVVQDKAAPKLLQLDPGDNTSEAAINNADIGLVMRALRQLPIRQREAVVLRYYVDLNERETAETMGIKTGSVKSHAARGIATLRRVLGPRMVQFR